MPDQCSILPPQMRETQEDFYSPTESLTLVSSSLDLREDAVSPDYQVAFSYGPAQIGTLVSGAVNRVWKIQHVTSSYPTGSIYIQGANSGSYSTQSLLFHYTNSVQWGKSIEVDLGFGSDGRPVVAMERTGSGVWLYWYNPFAAAYQLDRFSNSGSTPRLIHDIPEDPANSDLLLFYVSKSAGTMHYRQQRDAYGTEYNISFPKFFSLYGTASGLFYDVTVEGTLVGTGSGYVNGVSSSGITSGSLSGSISGIWTGSATGIISGGLIGTYSGTAGATESIYLEDAVKLQDSRVALFFTRHNVDSATYQTGRFETVLFPIYPDIQHMDMDIGIVSISLYNSTYYNFDIDSVLVSSSIYTGSLKETLLSFWAFDIDSVTASSSLYTGSLKETLLYHSIFDIDSVTASSSLTNDGILYESLLSHYAFDVDSVLASSSLSNGSLETV